MSERKLHVEIVTPYELFYEGDVEQLVLTAIDGEIGIRPGHMPVIIALNPGEIRMTVDGEVSYVSASDGYAQIEVDNAIVVVGSAEWPEQIDVERAEKALDRSVKRIHDSQGDPRELIRGQRGVLRAKARMKVAKHVKQTEQEE